MDSTLVQILTYLYDLERRHAAALAEIDRLSQAAQDEPEQE